MPFNRKPQKFNAAIKSVVIGSGDKTVTLGGENVLPFYAFDGEIKNGPKVLENPSDYNAMADRRLALKSQTLVWKENRKA